MDNPVQRPLGLAALITATVTLLSTGAMEQTGQQRMQDVVAQQAPNKIALSSHAFSPSIVTALQSSSIKPAEIPIRARTRQLRSGQPLPQSPRHLNKKQLQGHNGHPELQKELPEDIRTARLMLSVESLLKATTTN